MDGITHRQATAVPPVAACALVRMLSAARHEGRRASIYMRDVQRRDG